MHGDDNLDPMNNEKLFTQTSPTRLFFMVALPGAVSMAASSLYTVSEGLFVGRFLGSTAFAAVNLALPLVIINYAIADLLGVGSSVPISIALGRGDEDEANNIFSSTIVLILAAGLLTGSLLFFGAPSLFRAMGAEGELLDNAIKFLRVNAMWSPITTIAYAVDNYLRICGRIRRSTSANILMSGLGIALMILFLGVWHLDVAAAGHAFCLATFIAVCVAFWPFFKGELQLHFVQPQFSRALIRRVVGDGTPTFLSNIASQTTALILNFFLLKLGGPAAVTIYGMVMYFDGMVFPLVYGMLDSLQPAVGFNWGRHDVHRVKQIELRCFAAAAVVCMVALVLLWIYPDEIVHIFITDAHGDNLVEAIRALRLFSLGYLVRWLVMGTYSMLVALSQPRLASILSLCNAFIFPVALVFLLYPLGLLGMWLNYVCAEWLGAILSLATLYYFRRELRGGKIEIGR
ncbi:MATE family efflux transporter [uncultured Olegusella sp.]|uniref:MATE family efflux transporter n=1 Tax=uncultured Olegusella sp. TaxID=1979846 RepID=UPI0026372E75|nr:MATE family efflux transporter [uncultured Olegusella sp.]